MKNLKLTAFGNTYNLSLIEDTYTTNGRKYYGLLNNENGDFFSDITVNDPNEQLEDNEYLIDNDFILCFNGAGRMQQRLEKNLNIKSFWQGLGYYHFTI